MFFFGAWVGFFASLALYDWRTLRRVHAVTLSGCAWFALAWGVSVST